MPKKIKHTVCDEKVFSSIYKQYAKDLHDYLYYKFGSQMDINDKVQDAFMKLWDNCKDIVPEKARAFLFTVGKNMMLNKFKHQKVILKFQEIKPKDYTNETPEFLLEEEQFYQKYQKALNSLNEEQRVAFLLNKVEGKRHKEIAEILNITSRVVEYRIYSAFKIIKEQVKGFK
ncbi:MAG TPA: sigma-70 family RNA polymerase sigma factor [Flavobacteriia bacterium]|nr:sigma-70 family RNA polymerase sigma factor [Flavobacteriia bacterium]